MTYRSKVAWIFLLGFALDLVNILGIKNLLSLTYSSDLAAQGAYPFIRQYQLGFLPLFYYRVDFGMNPRR